MNPIAGEIRPEPHSFKNQIPFVLWVLSASLLSCSPHLAAAESAPGASWLRAAWGGRVEGYGVAVDPNGNVLITGGCSGWGVSGSMSLAPDQRFYVAKYDSAGDLNWVRTCRSAGLITGQGVTSDKLGNVYVTGYFEGSAILETNVLSNKGSYDAFVAKYDSAGNLLWVRTGGGADADYGEAIAVDDTGNVFVGGNIQGNITFGSIPVVNTGQKNFVVKYDTDGNLSWIRTAGSRFGSIGIGLAVSISGDLFVGGSFSDSSVFGTTKLVATGISDIFLAKYTTAGGVVWARSAGGGSCFECDPLYHGNQALGVVADVAGNAYVTGGFWATGSFGTKNLTTRGNVDLFLAKYDPSGNLLWVRQDGGDGYDYGRSIALDRLGNLYVAGQFSGTAKFGSTVIKGGPVGLFQTLDNFLAKYDAAGNPLWVLRLGTNDYTQQLSTAVDLRGNAFVVGASRTPVTILDNSLTNEGTATLFLAKLDTAPRPSLDVTQTLGGIEVLWPDWATNYVLQIATNLAEPPVWSTIITIGNSAVIPSSNRHEYFRLQRP